MRGGKDFRSKDSNDAEREKTEDLLVNDSNADGRRITELNKIVPPHRSRCFSPNTRRKCGIRPEFSYRDNITVRGRKKGDASEGGGGKTVMGNPRYALVVMLYTLF